jgi:hypothetical protein
MLLLVLCVETVLCQYRRPAAIYYIHALAARTNYNPSIVIVFIMIGTTGLSCWVSVVLIAFTISMPSVTTPKTGCWEGVLLLNQSRKPFCAVLMKNWLPPESGWPVFAMLSVPISFDVFDAQHTNTPC